MKRHDASLQRLIRGMILKFIFFFHPSFREILLVLLCTTCVLFPGQFLLPAMAFADHLQHYESPSAEAPEAESTDLAPEMTWPGVEKVNITHSYLSSTVENLSQRIDMFFGEDRVYEESTGTYIQARSTAIIEEDSELDYDLKFRAKLRLPQLKSKYRLLIENVDERGNLDDFNRDSKGSSLIDEFERSDFSASLQYFIAETKKWNVSLRPGIRLSNPVEVFMKLRLSRSKQFTERWLARATAQGGYFTDDGWESDIKIDFERRTGHKDFFRSSSSAIWRERSPGNQFLVQTFLFTRILNPRSSVALELGVSGETRPTLYNTSYFTNVRYRRDIHRGWLFMELRPRVVFAKENNYDEELSLLLSLEIILGADYAH